MMSPPQERRLYLGRGGACCGVNSPNDLRATVVSAAQCGLLAVFDRGGDSPNDLRATAVSAAQCGLLGREGAAAADQQCGSRWCFGRGVNSPNDRTAGVNATDVTTHGTSTPRCLQQWHESGRGGLCRGVDWRRGSFVPLLYPPRSVGCSGAHSRRRGGSAVCGRVVLGGGVNSPNDRTAGANATAHRRMVHRLRVASSSGTVRLGCRRKLRRGSFVPLLYPPRSVGRCGCTQPPPRRISSARCGGAWWRRQLAQRPHCWSQRDRRDSGWDIVSALPPAVARSG